jgi:hypothetical protein
MRFYMTDTYCETKIQLKYKDNFTATAIQKAIIPDNIGIPDGIKIWVYVEQNILRIEAYSNRNLGSLVSTLDDLLSCIQSAEKALEDLP